jgi:hypothetical protein
MPLQRQHRSKIILRGNMTEARRRSRRQEIRVEIVTRIWPATPSLRKG